MKRTRIYKMNKNEKAFSNYSEISNKKLLISIILYISALFYLSRRTLDFTDESYYLLSIRDFRYYEKFNGISKFGAIYHNILQISDSLIFLRFTSQLIISLLSVFLLWRINRFLGIKPTTFTAISILFLSLLPAFSTSGYLISPNYNTATLIGLLGVAISILENRLRIRSISLASSLVLLYFSKPTSFIFVILSLLVMAYYLDKLRFRIVLILGTLTFFGIVIGYQYTDGGIVHGYRNLQISYSLLDRSHTIGLITNLLQQFFPSNYFTFFAVVTVIILITFEFIKTNDKRFIVILTICLLPLCGVAGTNTNIWDKVLQFMIIDLIVAFTLIHSKESEIININFFISMLLIGSLVIIAQASYKTYRSDFGIIKNNTSINVPRMGNVLIPKQTKKAIEPAVIAIKSYSGPQDRILDATGQLPAVALLTDKKTTGMAWFGMGTNSSVQENIALRYLKCDSRSKLVIIEFVDKNNLDVTSILKYFHLNIGKDFSIIYEDRYFDPYKVSSSHLRILYSKKNLTCS